VLQAGGGGGGVLGGERNYRGKRAQTLVADNCKLWTTIRVPQNKQRKRRDGLGQSLSFVRATKLRGPRPNSSPKQTLKRAGDS